MTPHDYGYDQFVKTYEEGKAFLYCDSVFADCETPVSTYVKLTNNAAYSFLLESVEGGSARARYSVIGYDPDVIWRASLKECSIKKDGIEEKQTGSVLENLRSLIQESRIRIPDFLPSMAAGIFGYMGYDTIRYVEKIDDKNEREFELDDALYLRPKMICVMDNAQTIHHFCYVIRPQKCLDARQAWEKAVEYVTAETQKLCQPLPAIKTCEKESICYEAYMSEKEYCDIVEKAKKYIKEGDIFQVVLSQRFSITSFTPGGFAFYRALRVTNPSPYLFYMNLEHFTIIGASPETMCRLEGDKITIRPLAGTRKRGKNKQQDQEMKNELLQDQKERAEHLMLLDLGRNDVGRASHLGSVEVTEQFEVEFYSHVMHIVSNVEGHLRKELDALDVLLAGMPAGTVSGAPKVRAMEIIEELEPLRRGFYAGCVGYFSANGDMDHSIALRTALFDKRKQALYLQAGAGIVYDSDPKSEHQECINKSEALVKAAEKASKFLFTSNSF